MSINTTKSLKTSAEDKSTLENIADIDIGSTFNNEYSFTPYTIKDLNNSVSFIEVIGNSVVL